MTTRHQLETILSDPDRLREAAREREGLPLPAECGATAEELTAAQELNLADYKARGFRRIGGILAACERELAAIARGEPFYDEVPSPESQDLARQLITVIAPHKRWALNQAEGSNADKSRD